ncbi:MAG: GHKL domain-containing protein [Deltaproteobacteria bacterium]|nr:GHKL domain-containing protein [Deltaproteobacteria bacterium]
MEEALLRKLGNHYYGVFLLRVFGGIIHNLNGPLQSLYIRSEQVEQNLTKLQHVLESRELGKADELASLMTGKMKGILTNLDGLNAQLRGLASNFVTERRSEVGDVQLDDVIESCLFVLNADMFFKHEVNKTFNLNDALSPVKARATDLSIIVLNLVQNALEAMTDSEDKNLLIETAMEDNQVILRIQDSGCGIPEKDLKEIYRIFFTTKKGMGSEGEPDEHSGLGLSIVSLLLKDCGGEISCESLPGKTTFTIQIPAIKNPTEL